MNKIKELEEKIESEWMDRNPSTPISIRNLVDLVAAGLEECHEDEMCIWRDYATNGYCRCTRDALPSAEAVQLYEELRQLTLRVKLAQHLGELAKLPQYEGENTNDGTN